MKKLVQSTNGLADTVSAETTVLAKQISEKTTVLEENKLVLFAGFEDTTALEDKKGLTIFSAIAVVCCTRFLQNYLCAYNVDSSYFIAV